VTSSIVRVTRGETIEVYRIALLGDGSATLERFDNGRFGSARRFEGWRGAEREHGSSRRSESDGGVSELDRAIRHITSYLNGAVSVGERDLLSPASAMARNVRWFPGDLQMLVTASPYVRELFPSAQFHVTQLLRRVFGDVAFLLSIGVSAVFWLRTDAPVGLTRLAIGLLVLSMAAIVGFDAWVAPFRLAWQNLQGVRWRRRGLRVFYQLPLVGVASLLRGALSVGLNTVIGLSNVVINPPKILDSWRSVQRGKSLEWKASSVSAGQDVRGWPLAEFLDTYRPAFRVGLGLLVFAAWLVLLGAPLGLLGLSGLGVFIASFLSAAFYAWYAALPRAASDATPRSALPHRELSKLMLAGAFGLGLSLLAWQLGVYPLPAFEGSVALVALFLTLSASFALVYPLYHQVGFAIGRARWGRPWMRRCLGWAAACGVLALLSLAPKGLGGALLDGEEAWRMPEPERRVYEAVQRDMRRQGRADPAPLLSASPRNGVALKKLVSIRSPDLRPPRGVPAPRLPRVQLGSAGRELEELYPLPLARRLPMVRPARQVLVPPFAPEPEAPLAREVGREQTLAAQRRALALTPRVLSPDELRAQAEFIERASYPWIGRDELRRLTEADPSIGSVPLLEMARAERWDDIQKLWGRVEAAERGGVPDRVRLARLREGVEGALALGLNPGPAEVQRFLAEERELIDAWSERHPNLPLSALASGAATRGRFFELTRFMLEKHMPRAELESRLRLDYANAYWAEAPVAEVLHQVFRDRTRIEPWERLTLDWEGNEGLRRRWEDLQTEQAVASKIWRAAARGDAPASSSELRQIVIFLDRVLGQVLERSNDTSSPYSTFAELFRLEGVDRRALASGDTVAALLASRVWTSAMAGRVAQIVSHSAAGLELPGSEADRALVREIARARYPDAADDPLLGRAFEWLTLIDGAETYEELALGYDRFASDSRDLGLSLEGLARAPRLSHAQLYADLIDLWHELPRRFPGLPAREPMVSEVLCQTAYFSSRDGQNPRRPRELLDDFAGQLGAVEAHMDDEPPAAVQRLSDRHFENVQGRASPSPRARRFFAWLMVAVQAEVLAHNLERHGKARPVDLDGIARSFADVLEAGAERYRYLPWQEPGFAEYFVQLMEVRGQSRSELFSELSHQLGDSNQLMARHTVPFKTFEAVVDRRIQSQTGSMNMDPTLRRANALIGLAELCRVLEANATHACRESPVRVTEAFSLLYEKLERDYPRLDWESEGLPEFYLLTELRQGWTLYQVVERFAPEWALANALAARGWLTRFEAIAARPRPLRAPEADAQLAHFVDTQAARLEQKTGLRIQKPRARAMNALLSLASLTLSATEEGLLPGQRGAAWSKARARAWAQGLGSAGLDAATADFVGGLLDDWTLLASAMQEAGPSFPWHAGAILETQLYSMRGAGATVVEMRDARAGSWRAASELVERQSPLAPEFQALVRRDAMAALRLKLAAARGVDPATVSDAEVEPEDPALVPLDATLALADVVAMVRLQHRVDPDPNALAERIARVRRLGPARYPHIPWSEQGFVPSLVVAAYGPDFERDFWRYPELLDYRRVDALLAALAQPGAAPLPAEVLADVRDGLLRETGRTPASEPLLVLSVVQDGVSMLQRLLPDVEPTLDNVVTITRLRSRLRALSDRYAELGIVRAADDSVRTGFAERLAALALQRARQAGDDPAGGAFVDRAVARVEAQLLGRMQPLIASVRASLPAEELDYYKTLIADEARLDNPALAARHGLSADHLSLPDVKTDDLVADAAVYEILYADEIGQDQRYLSALFEIFGQLSRRASAQHDYQRGLAQIDARYLGALARPGSPDYERWRASSGYRRWWKERGDFIRASRGRTIGLARTFALVKRAAFELEAEPEARASFARFGSFEQYLERVMSAYEGVAEVPELRAALDALRAEDGYLADGVWFALALLDCHVLERVYPGPGEAQRALNGIAAALPAVTADLQRSLGFVPRFESGVSLYDARRVFQRRELEPGAGTRLFYRLDLLQRGVQHWPQTYLLQQAYHVLFFQDLDLRDPTPVPGASAPAWLERLHPALAGAHRRWLTPSRGELAREFFERRLPELLEANTGSRDPSAWLAWLMQHGEVGLDGTPTGNNPHADEVRHYEERLAHYRALVDAGTRAGTSVRAEQQRVRDIERQYASYRRQVDWLTASAGRHAALGGQARGAYATALAYHAFLPLALCLFGWSALGGLRRRLRARRRALAAVVGVLALALPLVLVALPCAVAWAPEPAARVAERSLGVLRLLGRDAHGSLEPRGAAAQLAKLAPWPERGP
jgi:hypothetical protein